MGAWTVHFRNSATTCPSQRHLPLRAKDVGVNAAFRDLVNTSYPDWDRPRLRARLSTTLLP